jgi:transcriptional regulator with XRE-family HTH domain
MDGVRGQIDEDAKNLQPGVSAGWRLKHRRGELGWTQATLARRFREVGAWYRGAPKQLSSLISMISKWESGDIVPDPYNLHVLAEALGVEVDALGFRVDPHFVLPLRRDVPLPLD